jgi:hypothetical protein
MNPFSQILALIDNLDQVTRNLDPFRPETLATVKAILGQLTHNLDGAQETIDGIREQVSGVQQLISIWEQ